MLDYKKLDIVPNRFLLLRLFGKGKAVNDYIDNKCNGKEEIWKRHLNTQKELNTQMGSIAKEVCQKIKTDSDQHFKKSDVEKLTRQ